MRDYGDDYSGHARLQMERRACHINAWRAFVPWEKYFTELGDGDPVKGEEIHRARIPLRSEIEFAKQAAAYDARQKSKKERNIEALKLWGPDENKNQI